MDKILAAEVCGAVKPVVEGLGFELWGCEMVGEGHQKLLRLYIDSPTGVTVDDCAKVSQQVSGVLDVEDLIMSRYNLEVSSPGLERVLFSKEHYQRFVGSTVKISLQQAVSGSKNYRGVIAEVREKSITLTLEHGGQVSFELANIKKAKLQVD